MRVVSGDGPGVYLLGMVHVRGKRVGGRSVSAGGHRGWVRVGGRGSSENSQGNQCAERISALHFDPPVYIDRTLQGRCWIQKERSVQATFLQHAVRGYVQPMPLCAPAVGGIVLVLQGCRYGYGAGGVAVAMPFRDRQRPSEVAGFGAVGVR